MVRRSVIFYLVILFLLSALGLLIGEVWTIDPYIVLNLRLPKIITAIAAGGALGVAGLLMQTHFRNPLAGPFVLGINSGASLGVAFFVIVFDSFHPLGLAAFSMIGSFVILLALLILSKFSESKATQLIFGLMMGYVCDAVINVLMAVGASYEIQSFVHWGLGTFSRLSLEQSLLFFAAIIPFVLIACFKIKDMNALILGESVAGDLGVNIKKLKFYFLVITGVLSGIVTAFCGPIAFLGIMAPHICRSIFKTSDNFVILPMTFVVGGAIAVIASIGVAQFAIPTNAMLSIVGAPVLLYYFYKFETRYDENF